MLSTTGKNKAVDGIAGAVSHVSVHSALPDATGSSEHGTRQAVAWSAASGGTRANSGALSHAVSAATTIYAYGLWDAASAGNFIGVVPYNSGARGFGSVDVLATDTIKSAGHGLVDTDRVMVWSTFAESLPAGLAENTAYYVVSSTTDTFKLSTTSGGAAIDITALGELFFVKFVPEVFASAGTVATAIAALVLDATGI